MGMESINRSIFKQVNNDSVFREKMFIESISEYFGIISDENARIISEMNILFNQLDEENKKEHIDYKELKRINFRLNNEKKKLYLEINKIREKVKNPSLKKLENAIKNLNDPKYKFTKEDAELQITMLSDYLEYQVQAGNFTEFVGSIGFDNKKTKTLIENKLQQISWNKMVENGFILNPENILDKTFIGEMKRQKEDLFPLFKDMFISLDDRALPAFTKLYEFLENRNVYMSNDDKSLLINKYQNFFIAYVIQNMPFKYGQTETTISEMFPLLMRGSQSLANKLNELKKSPDFNISQNLVIKELLPIFSTNLGDEVDNIKLFRNKMDTYKNDVLIESMNNLLDYAKATGNIELESFINNLTIFTVLQSGFQNSTINFTKILPAHLYSKFINELLKMYQSSDMELNYDLIWQQFHQNNKFDRNINKKPKFIKRDVGTTNILLDTDYSDSQYEFIIQSSPKNGIDDNKIKTLSKFKKTYKAFDYWIYKRVGYTDIEGKEYAIYSPIIPLGDGRNYTETSLRNLLQSNIAKNNVVTSEGFKQRTTYQEESFRAVLPVEMQAPLAVASDTEQLLMLLNQFKQIGLQFGLQNPSLAAVAPNMSNLTPDGGENISSNGSAFAKKLTNAGNNVAVKFRNVVFRNAEHAYQTWKSGEFDKEAFESKAFKPKGSKKTNFTSNYGLMVSILKAKLEQHPDLMQGINERGGLSYINASTHDVYGKDKFWETKSGKNKFIEALAKAYKELQPKSVEGYGFDSVSVTKEKYTRELVRKNQDTAYVYTENNYSITAFPDKEGGGTAIIRPELNAYPIVTKKKYDYNTKENVDYSNTDADFEEFNSVNTELINNIKQSGKSKVVFPDGFATNAAKLPTRFALWLQKELYDNFGLVTELNKTKDGLISTSVTKKADVQEEKTLKLMDGNTYPISEIDSKMLKSLGYTPIQITNITNSLYTQIKTNSGKTLTEINVSKQEWDSISTEEKNKIKKCN
jgi:hypothetical protein